MLDLNIVARDAMKEVITENNNLFKRDGWYLEKYETKHTFSTSEELVELSNSQYTQSMHDWVDNVFDKGMEKLCGNLGIQYPLPVSFQAERLATGLEEVVKQEIYDYIYVPKKDMESHLAMKEQSMEK